MHFQVVHRTPSSNTQTIRTRFPHVDNKNRIDAGCWLHTDSELSENYFVFIILFIIRGDYCLPASIFLRFVVRFFFCEKKAAPIQTHSIHSNIVIIQSAVYGIHIIEDSQEYRDMPHSRRQCMYTYTAI